MDRAWTRIEDIFPTSKPGTLHGHVSLPECKWWVKQAGEHMTYWWVFRALCHWGFWEIDGNVFFKRDFSTTTQELEMWQVEIKNPWNSKINGKGRACRSFSDSAGYSGANCSFSVHFAGGRTLLRTSRWASLLQPLARKQSEEEETGYLSICKRVRERYNFSNEKDLVAWGIDIWSIISRYLKFSGL